MESLLAIDACFEHCNSIVSKISKWQRDMCIHLGLNINVRKPMIYWIVVQSYKFVTYLHQYYNIYAPSFQLWKYYFWTKPVCKTNIMAGFHL